MKHWQGLRSFQAQLVLWAVLPLVFVLLALMLTGVYTHQHAMHSFVMQRDTMMARWIARLVTMGVQQGSIDPMGSNVAAYLAETGADMPVTWMVLDPPDRVLAWGGPAHGAISQSPFPPPPDAVVSIATVQGTPWHVVLIAYEDEILDPILRYSNAAPWLAALAALLSLVILILGWRTLGAPLERLAKAVQSTPDTSQVPALVEHHGVIEIQALAQALRDLFERIGAYEYGIQAYLEALTERQEEERAHLARELHDGPVQGVIALGQRLQLAQQALHRGEVDRALDFLEELQERSLALVQDLRRAIGVLRPAYLEDLGFLPALEMLVQQVRHTTALTVQLEHNLAEQRFAPGLELAAYRIVQEALSNVVRHAQASTVQVRVWEETDQLVLTIHDDGQGFEVPVGFEVWARLGHFGLLGMRERVRQWGGTLQIESMPGQGTRIMVVFPVIGQRLAHVTGQTLD